jgi:hypothetical protein
MSSLRPDRFFLLPKRDDAVFLRWGGRRILFGGWSLTVGRTRLAILLLMGCFTAAGMIVMLGRLGAAAPTAGFGLELVRRMVEQGLDGTFELSKLSGGGTRAEVIFPTVSR